jgi:hypothetical protein
LGLTGGTLAWITAGLGSGASAALDNLDAVAINASLVPGTAGALDFGSTTKPWASIYLAGTSGTPGTNQFKITGASNGGLRTITLPNDSGTVALTSDTVNFWSAATAQTGLTGNKSGSFSLNTTGTGTFGKVSYNEADWVGGHVYEVPDGGDLNTYITNASSGDTLVLASATYVITSPIIIDKQLKIIGQGTQLTKIYYTIQSGNAIVVSVSNVELENFAVMSSSVDPVIKLQPPSPGIITNNYLTNVSITQMNGDAGSGGVDADILAISVIDSDLTIFKGDLTTVNYYAGRTATGILYETTNDSGSATNLGASFLKITTMGDVQGTAIEVYDNQTGGNNTSPTLTDVLIIAMKTGEFGRAVWCHGGTMANGGLLSGDMLGDVVQDDGSAFNVMNGSIMGAYTNPSVPFPATVYNNSGYFGGNVGIGTAATSTYALDGVGSSNDVARFRNNSLDTTCSLASATGIIVCSSDERLKKNMTTLDNPLALILQLDPISFNWNKDLNNQYKNFGFSAQAVEQVIPELVSTDDSGYKLLAMDNMIPFLVGAIKQQQADIDALKQKIETIGDTIITSGGVVGDGTVSGVDTTSLLDKITNVLASLGISIKDGITHINQLAVQKSTTDVARIKMIEMVDSETGDVYCTWIKNGEWQKVKGSCDLLAPPAPPPPLDSSVQNKPADTTAPAITLNGDNTINIAVGDSYTDAGAFALDDVDGDITSKIVVVNPVDTSVAGTYTITYDVSDVAGNKATETTRTVVVAEKNTETITPVPVADSSTSETVNPKTPDNSAPVENSVPADNSSLPSE